MPKLILYNIEYLQGMTGRKLDYLKFWRRFRHPAKIDKKIIGELKKYNPDILALIEIDSGSFTEDKNEINYFKKHLGMNHQAIKIKYKGVLRDLPVLGKQANAILSKEKLLNVKEYDFKEGVKRVVIEADINLGGKVKLILVHLALGKKDREKQVNELIQVVKDEKKVILMGDFNTFYGEKELSRLLRTAGLNKSGKEFTFPSYNPKKKLDYILTRGIKVKDYKVLNLKYSDHLPVMINFEVK